MKLINEKGQLFGLINVIDLLVLLAVVIAAVGIGWKVLGTEEDVAEAPSNAVTVTYKARARGVYPYMAESYLSYGEELPLQLVSNTSYLAYATLDKIEVEPSRVLSSDTDGNVTRQDDPELVDVIFTCTAQVSPDDAVMSVGVQELRVGASHTVKTRYFEASSTIQSIEIMEAGE